MATIRGHGPTRGYWKGAIDGGNIFWIAPIYKQAAKIWRELKRSTQDYYAAGLAEKRESEMEIVLPNGGMVSVRSADNPDSLRGEGLDGAVLDEAAFMKPDIWNKVVRPMLSDKLGWAMFPTTPNGYNWWKDLHDVAETREGWKAWHLPTSDNPIIPASEIDEARATLSTLDFDQEYLSLFVQQQGVEWPGNYFGASIWYEGLHPPDCDCTVIADDPSKGQSDKSDYNAMITVRHDPRGTYWIEADIDRLDVSGIIDRAVSACRRSEAHAIGFESVAFQELMLPLFAGAANRSDLRINYYGIDNATIKKKVRIRSLGPLLREGKIRIKRDAGGIELVEQLREFPVAKYDDGPDALEMGIRLCDAVMSELPITGGIRFQQPAAFMGR